MSVSERTKKYLLYAMIFITAGIVLVIEPLSHVFGFSHKHSGHPHESPATPHSHEPSEDGNRAH